MTACRWTKNDTYCETHHCGFGDPCLVRGCPHCDRTPAARRYTRLVAQLQKAESAALRLEQKTSFYMRRLLAARRLLAQVRKRLLSLEAHETHLGPTKPG